MNDVQSIIADTARRAGLDPNLMLRIAQIESGSNPSARNTSSGAAGLFQFIPSLWASYGLDATTVFDARANSEAAARKLVVAYNYLTQKGIAVEPWMLYLAHQQGNYGASVILQYAAAGRRIDELPTTPANIRRNVTANIPAGKKLTLVADFADLWRQKISYATPAGASPRPVITVTSRPAWHWGAAILGAAGVVYGVARYLGVPLRS